MFGCPHQATRIVIFSSSVLLSEANTGSVAQLTKLAVSEIVTSDFARTVIKDDLLFL